METMPYAIYYNDGTYMIYDLTETDYDQLRMAIVASNPALISIGILITSDIRSVIIQKPAPEGENEGTNPELTPEEREFLREQAEIREFADRGFV